MVAKTQPTRRPLPRWAVLATVAAALVVVGVLVAISATGGTSSKGSGQLVGATDAIARVAGIPQAGNVLGNPTAAIEIVEYGDMQCPFCAQAAEGTVSRLITTYVKPGTAKLTFRPLAFIGPDSRRGALAVAAAGEQGKLWTFVDLTYRNQGGENDGWLSEQFVRDAATAIDLDVGAFDAARASGAAKDLLERAQADATRDGVSSTPSFLVRGPRGTKAIRDYANFSEFEAAVAAVR